MIKKILKKARSAINAMSSIELIVNRRCTISMYKQLYITSDNIGTTQELHNGQKIIVSLTTFGNKLQNVYLTIESLLHQTMKPNEIILWLDETRYSQESLPLTLQTLQTRGLSVRFCKDVRSYTKVVHAFKQYPEDIVISTDDDILYPIDFIERLLVAYDSDPKKIYFYRGHKIVLDEHGNVKPYLDWVKEGANGASLMNVPTGVDGILYPPHCYHEDMCNEELFLKLCPYADDLWFKVMTLLQGTICEQIPLSSTNYFMFVPLDINAEESLQSINVVDGKNDIQFKNLVKHYNLLSILRDASK